MDNLKRKIQRFQFNGVLLILGLCVASFVFFQITDAIDRINTEKSWLNYYQFTQSFGIVLTDEAKNSDEFMNCHSQQLFYNIIEKALECECNSFYSSSLAVENSSSPLVLTTILNSTNTLHLIDSNGMQITNPLEISTNGILIGHNILPLTEKGEGKKLSISGEILPIVCVLKDFSAAGYDYSMYCDWVHTNDILRKKIYASFSNSQGSVITFADSSPIESQVSAFLKDIQSLDQADKLKIVKLNNYKFQKSGDNGYLGKFYLPLTIISLGASLLFSLFCCYSVSALWMAKRKKELAIRKAFGFSECQLTILVMTDYLLFMLPSILLSLFLQLVYCCIINQYFFFTSHCIEKLLMTFAGNIIIIISCLQHNFSIIRKVSPAMATREE